MTSDAGAISSVGVPYGKVEWPSSQIYIDGVTKATASVRIAHESIVAAANAVARKKVRGISVAPAPDLSHDEDLSFDDLVAEGIARRHQVSNRDMQEFFRDLHCSLSICSTIDSSLKRNMPRRRSVP